MELTAAVIVDVSNFKNSDADTAEDVLKTLLSHFDDIGHLLGEANITWYSATVFDESTDSAVVWKEESDV